MTMHPFIRRDKADLSATGLLLPVPPRDPGPEEEFHRWPLPGYVWPALERCYHSIFCSEPHLRIHNGISPGIEAWVARRDGRISTLLLFERNGTVAKVINEVFVPTGDAIAAFARALFEHHRELDAIEIRAAHLVGKVPGYRTLSALLSEDFVLPLPATADEWLAGLSAQTREKIRYHLRRTQRKQPSFRFRVVQGAQIDDEQLRTVMDFNRARMRKKGRRFGMQEDEERRLCRLMRERGRIALIEIDGEVRAGLLCTLAGNDIYMHVIAHDPEFDDLRLGFLCCVLTIQDAISAGMQRFHFLWGHYDYKIRLGGKHVTLYRLLLLRGPLAAVRHPGLLVTQLAATVRSWLRLTLRRWRTRQA